MVALSSPVAERVVRLASQGSMIRQMFEEGARLRARYGAANVHDFSLGNPVFEPPVEYVEALRACVNDTTPGTHRYMLNAGFEETRAAVAGFINRGHHLEGAAALGAAHIVMTVGAAGSLNIAFKALLDPGDEVVILAPYFPEYVFYADNHDAKAVVVETDATFEPDVGAIAAAINGRTRAVLINSPNNPTGRLYKAETIAAIGAMLREKTAEFGRPIWLLSDEPYARLVYDGHEVPSVFGAYEHAMICTSFSKDLSLPGERIGYAAVSARSEFAADVVRAMTFCNRVLGYINAPALQQRAIARCIDASVAIDAYAERRAKMLLALDAAGIECVRPEGAFYLFPKVPVGFAGGDDVAFASMLAKHRVLVVPGTGFGRRGHFRISYAVEMETIEKAAPILAQVGAELGLN